MVVWIALVGGAVAGEPELDVERGRVAYELERYTAARDRAIEALASSPNLASAHQLYIDATTAAGLGSRGLFELVSSEAETPPWHGPVRALEQAVADGDWRAIRDTTEQIAARWPQSPDLVAPLWESPSGRVERLRTRWLEGLVAPEALAAADLETLYRLRRLVVEIRAETARAAIEQALVDRGEDQPPPRAPLGRIERTDLALQLSKEPVPALPWGYPTELVDTALRLEEIWAKARRFRHIAMAWQQVQRISDDPTAWTHEATAWLAENELEKAAAAADAAVDRATRPRGIDLAALNAHRQRADLAAALLARARIYEARGDVPRAYGDYAVAVLLAERTLDDKLGERLESTSIVAAQQIGRSYPGPVPAEGALSAAVRGKDRDTALGNASDARFLAAFGTRGARTVAEAPEAYRELFASSWMAEASAEAGAGRVERARTAAVIATVLVGRTHPWWWTARAQAQDQNGEYDAAFASWAIARGQGVPGLEADLQRTYVGVSGWEVAANNLGGAPPDVAVAPEPAGPSPAGTSGRPQQTKSQRPSTAPRLGEPFPAFSIDTGEGLFTDRSLHGRKAVLLFFGAQCEECFQMLPAFGSLARRLRGEGRDVVVIGVSVDPERAAFEQIVQRGRGWAQLIWAPVLRDRFAISRVPTIWVIDTAGISRYYVDHWLSVEELETYVRDVD